MFLDKMREMELSSQNWIKKKGTIGLFSVIKIIIFANFQEIIFLRCFMAFSHRLSETHLGPEKPVESAINCGRDSAVYDPASVGVKVNERNQFFLCFIDGLVKLGPFKKLFFDKTR